MSKDDKTSKHDRGPAQPADIDQPENADQTMATEATEHEVEMSKAKKHTDAGHDNPLPSTAKTPPD